MNRDNMRVTLIWIGGLIIVLALGVLWLGSLGLGIFKIYGAHGAGEIGGYSVVFGLVLLATGIAIRWFVNRFHDWHRDQGLEPFLKEINDSVSNAQTQAHIDKLTLDFSSEFSETFKSQLRSSGTFQATVNEAQRLVEEFVAFSAVPHTNKESHTFREGWQAKTEKFAERIAGDDPLAVEVILKAIQKESEKKRVDRS
jgi:hypothetical protein